MQNYHCHKYGSNIFVPDSAASFEDYAKRAKELGHKVLSSVEHGWQGYYFETFELAQKYDLQFVFGAEIYWVKDRHDKDKTNAHMILLAKTEKGRRAINLALSTANEDGYYFRPRLDLELILSLPPEDVFVTTACVAFWQYEDTEELVVQLRDHFKENFMLEIQYHATEKQIALNRRILELSKKYNIEMIVGMDSHYIYPDQAQEREYILEAKGVRYEDEDGWYMDYPDDETTMNRFLAQQVFTREQIQRAMDNTDVCLTFEDYTINNPIFEKTIKLPTLYDGKHVIDGKLLPALDQEGRNREYNRLVSAKFKEYMKDVDPARYQEYFDGVKMEVSVYRNTNMVDYPLLDYYIVKRAIEKGGLITNTGRGSGVGYFTNTLCGFSKVDRFTSPVKLYPERFISEARILQNGSIPDLDLNTGNPEIFAEAQTEILGADHAVPMIAFGTCKKKAAFKLYARSQNLDAQLANEISKQIGQYDEAYKNADDDDKADINIYDYVDPQYHSYVDASKKYWGIIMDKKKAPCAYLLYDGSIREEIGLIKCKSEATKKEYITTVVDGAVAEKYKFLKNDLLKVDVVLLIDMIYKRIGIRPHTVTELTELVKDNQKVWDIYANGLTIGVNQCEKDSTIRKVMKYKPTNVSELSAFIAAIRPGFKSMYSKFESREYFEYGIPTFDRLMQTEELPVSFPFFQEQLMYTLNYAGFPMDLCYGALKDLSKKRGKKVIKLKEQFMTGFSKKLIQEEQQSEELANANAERVWQVIADSCNYSFNSAHAYCMALDSLYCAYLKSHYPYEFYEVMLQLYSDKGKKDKVSALKQEMAAFGITEGPYCLGEDNRKFKADPARGQIMPSLLSIKGLNQKCSNEFYKMRNEKFDSFYTLYKAIKNRKVVNSGQLNILIEIGYFRNYGTIGKIKRFMKAIDVLYERTQFNKAQLPDGYEKIIRKYSEETDKQFRSFQYNVALAEIWDTLPDDDCPVYQKLKWELEHFGYIQTVLPALDPTYAFVQEYECKFKNPTITLYRLNDGFVERVKVKRTTYDSNPFNAGDIIKTVERSDEGRWSKDEHGNWVQDRQNKEAILKKWKLVK